ncbi:hypothetical protein GCK72_019449 [Caenorhabditis remanei]|uniref:Uncharacterized protein n=1 Tax=Caenorhabditis remanei TaxID=31234 RepID=A0A6A5GDT8_CAERE|nr:hypothetical protein GCK72_019449 [Caenorhabditis remanei]KAF1752894.1 hypothetical protein GCK72_019449 [Caenorhabditis remanei]
MADSASPDIEGECVEGKNKDIPSKPKVQWIPWREKYDSNSLSQCERERDEAANKARTNCLWNMLAAVMAMLLILCVTKDVFELITSFDQSWIGFIYGIEVFLCAAVIIHLFWERQRIKTEPPVKTQDMENAHHDSEEIKSIIKQTDALKNHHTFWCTDRDTSEERPREYISLCKTYTPTVDPALRERIVEAYVEICRDARYSSEPTFVSLRMT